MLVTGNAGPVDVDIEDVAYWYAYQGKLRFKLTDGSNVVIDFASQYYALLSAREYFAQHYRQVCTIGSTDQRTYYVNVANISSNSVVSNYVYIDFDPVELSIECIDSDTATYDRTYLNNVFTHYDYLNTFVGTIITVDDSGGEDYTTIAAANAAASSGNLIRIFPGTYTEDLILKNGVKYYFDDGAILAGKVAPTSATAFNCAILGQGEFRQSSASGYIFEQPQVYGGNVGGNPVSFLYMECKAIKTDANRSLFFGNCFVKLTLKGGTCAKLTAEYDSLIDTDTGIQIDIDMVSVIEASELSFIAFNSGTGRATFRNLKFVAGSNAVPSINGTSATFSSTTYKYQLVGVYIENADTASDYLDASIFCDADTEGASDYIVHLHDSIFKAGDTYSFSAYESAEIYTFGSNYSNKVCNANVTLSNPPAFEINSALTLAESDSPSENINVSIMALSNMPAKSKYQVGHLVCTKDTIGLTAYQVEVLQVRTRVSNPNNDSDGVQKNYYILEGYEGKEYPEEEVFWSRGHYLKSLSPAAVYHPTVAITTFDALPTLLTVTVGRNIIDLAGMDLTGADFTAGTLASINWESGNDDVNAILDGCNLTDCTLPTSVDTKAEMRAACYSYDALTVWTDGITYLADD